MSARYIALLVSAVLLLAGALACRVGVTPTPTPDLPTATRTPLPTITPLPTLTPTPTAPIPTETSSPSPTATPTPDAASAAAYGSLHVSAVRVAFYKSGKDGVPLAKRQYAERFARKSTLYVNWEIRLTHPAPSQRVDFKIHVIWYSPDGSILNDQDMDTYVAAGWKDSYHNWGWGWDKTNQWPVGKYRVEFWVGDQKIASGSFEIY
jgi:hypothetical protein